MESRPSKSWLIIAKSCRKLEEEGMSLDGERGEDAVAVREAPVALEEEAVAPEEEAVAPEEEEAVALETGPEPVMRDPCVTLLSF